MTECLVTLPGIAYSCDDHPMGASIKQIQELTKAARILSKASAIDIDDWRRPPIDLSKPLKKFPDNPRRYKK